jgi:hypothetical protein
MSFASPSVYGDRFARCKSTKSCPLRELGHRSVTAERVDTCQEVVKMACLLVRRTRVDVAMSSEGASRDRSALEFVRDSSVLVHICNDSHERAELIYKAGWFKSALLGRGDPQNIALNTRSIKQALSLLPATDFSAFPPTQSLPSLPPRRTSSTVFQGAPQARRRSTSSLLVLVCLPPTMRSRRCRCRLRQQAQVPCRRCRLRVADPVAASPARA